MDLFSSNNLQSITNIMPVTTSLTSLNGKTKSNYIVLTKDENISIPMPMACSKFYPKSTLANEIDLSTNFAKIDSNVFNDEDCNVSNKPYPTDMTDEYHRHHQQLQLQLQQNFHLQQHMLKNPLTSNVSSTTPGSSNNVNNSKTATILVSKTKTKTGLPLLLKTSINNN